MEPLGLGALTIPSGGEYLYERLPASITIEPMISKTHFAAHLTPTAAGLVSTGRWMACFVIALAVVLSGCSSNLTDVETEVEDEEEGILDVVQRLEAAPRNSVVLFDESVTLADGAVTVGTTTAGHTYGLFTGKQANSLTWAFVGSGDRVARPDCKMHEDAGWREQRRFGKCVAGLLNNGCVYMYKDDEGYIHAHPINCL